MNFKQKLAYMAIGCVFTLAGYFLATLGAGGFNPQNATAQDNTKQVIDEIITRKLKVVNSEGKTIAILGESLNGSGGYLYINNTNDKLVAGIGVSHRNSGFLSIRNKNGKPIAALSASVVDGALLTLRNKNGESFAYLSEDKNGNGALSIFNKTSGSRVGCDFDKNGDGRMFITNKSGKVVAALGAIDEHGSLVIGNKEGDPLMGYNFNKNGDGRLFIGNKSGKPVVGLGALDGHGTLLISNKSGKFVAGLGVEDNAGILSIANKNEIEVATLKAGFGDSGTLYIRDKDGQIAAELAANTTGRYLPSVQRGRERDGEKGVSLGSHDHGTGGTGFLSIYNKNGFEVATLGTSTTDSGILSIYNKEKKIAVRVGVDIYGWGGFQSFRGKWRTH